MTDPKNRFKTLLLFPPNYHPVLIHPSLPYLTAYLRGKGHNIIQRNLTPSAYKHLMPESLEVIESMRCPDIYLGHPEKFIELKKKIEKATAEVRHEDREFRISRNTFNYLPKRDSTHLDQLLLAIDEKEENLFYHFFREEVMRYVQEQNPQLVGIGITDHKQLVPGMILAAMIKEEFPEIRIVAGGHLITRTEEVLTSGDAKRLFDYVDYFIYDLLPALKCGVSC